MKNFENILADAGVEVTDEQKTAITKALGENYKPIADWQKQHDKVESLTEQLQTAMDGLKKFEGVDADALQKQIKDLQADLDNKDSDYQAQIADRDFQDMLKSVISEVNGKNSRAITALLDMEKLKGSKNQKDDIAAALKELSEAEDSKMLFGTIEPDGKTTPIGSVGKPGAGLSGVEAEFIKRNPDIKLE